MTDVLGLELQMECDNALKSLLRGGVEVQEVGEKCIATVSCRFAETWIFRMVLCSYRSSVESGLIGHDWKHCENSGVGGTQDLRDFQRLGDATAVLCSGAL